MNLVDIPLFLNKGGWVLWLIFFLCIVLLSLLAERGWFLLRYAGSQKVTLDWNMRADQSSSSAQAIRLSWLTREELNLHQHFNMIRTLIMLCPLAGLLGTVTGMIGLFGEMGRNGLPDNSLLLAGLTRICLPTLAGLAVALTGLWLFTLCQSAARKQVQYLNKHLPIQ